MVLPARSLTALEIVTVNNVGNAKTLVCLYLNTAVRPEKVTVPVTGPFAVLTIKVPVEMLPGSISSLNVAVRVPKPSVPTCTVAPFIGKKPATLGGVVSAGEPVVNVHVKSAAKWLPAKSVTPVVILTVTTVAKGNNPEGMNIAVLLEYVTAPAMGGDIINVEALMLDDAISSVKIAKILGFTLTPVCPLNGETVWAKTVGRVVS
jgi:hypothetical protein